MFLMYKHISYMPKKIKIFIHVGINNSIIWQQFNTRKRLRAKKSVYQD